MAGYIGSRASVVSSGAEHKKVFAITTTTTTLTGLSYTPTFVHVFHNGVRLVDGTDYTATNGTSITLTTAAQSGDEVVVISYATFQVSDTVSASAGGTFAGDVSVTGAFTSKGIDDNAAATAMTLDASGNVGIGTSSPATFSGYTTLGINNATNGGILDLMQGGSMRMRLIGLDGSAVIETPASLPILFAPAGTERMRIDASGNVGIGTSSPTAFGGGFIVSQTTGSSGGYSLQSSGSVVTQVAADSTASVGYTGTRSNHPHVFTTNNTERLRIDASGRMVVGLSAAFDTISKIQASGAGISLKNDYDGNNNNWSNIRNTAVSSQSNIYFESGNGNMTLDHSGNLLVGTTSQYGSQKLSLNGGIAIDGRSAATPGLSEKGDDNTGVFWPAADTLGFSTGGTERARIDSAGRVTMPYQPRFHATKSDGLIYSTLGVITFNLIARNNGNNFNGTRFTCPVSGDYFFYFHCHSENTPGEGVIGLRINGTSAWGGSQYTRQMDGNAAMTPITVNLIHSLSAGDYVELDNYSLIIWAGDSSSGVTFGGYLMG